MDSIGVEGSGTSRPIKVENLFELPLVFYINIKIYHHQVVFDSSANAVFQAWIFVKLNTLENI
jgi:hypothetical protein